MIRTCPACGHQWVEERARCASCGAQAGAAPVSVPERGVVEGVTTVESAQDPVHLAAVSVDGMLLLAFADQPPEIGSAVRLVARAEGGVRVAGGAS